MLKHIEVNGITLAYEEYGTGDRYLISTQNFFFKNCHEALMAKHPYNYHVFLIYMRGYGESTHIYDETPGDYTKLWGEDVIAFAEKLGIPSFYYTGISHGNFAGWYIAFHRPELLRGFACIDGVARYVDKSDPPRRPPFYFEDAMVGNREALSKIAWIEKWPTENPQRLETRAHNFEEHLEILMNRKVEEFHIVNTNFSTCDADSEEDFLRQCSELKVPIMIMNGGLDPLATSDACLALAKVIPGAKLVIYGELGHGGFDECPELAAEECDRFFRQRDNYIL